MLGIGSKNILIVKKSQKDYATCKQEADKVFQKMNNNLAWT